MVGDSVGDLPKDSGSLEWADGVDMVEKTGSPGTRVSASRPHRSSWGLRPLALGQFFLEDAQAQGASISAGTGKGTARGEFSPAPQPSPPPRWQPSCAPAATSSSLPLLPRSHREGRTGRWAGSFAALWLFASAAGAKQQRERAPRALPRALTRGERTAETR